MNIRNSSVNLIGNTPLLSYENEFCRVLCKIESKNPGGSVKDRVALYMIEEAEKQGVLTPGTRIIEATSGNTGIGLCAIAAAKGYPMTIVMPDTMSMERRLLMAAYGAQVVLSPGAEGMAGAIALSEKLAAEEGRAFIPAQFTNPANPKAHYETTGPELWRDTEGKIDIFVAGVGTGGTVTGVGRYLKEQNPNIQIVAVEPAASPLLSGGTAASHGLQGIGANFIPDNFDRSVCDTVIPVTEKEAYAAARMLGKKEGILVGISSGAALHAALTLEKQPENHGKTIAVLLPDTGDRYLSTPLFE